MGGLRVLISPIMIFWSHKRGLNPREANRAHARAAFSRTVSVRELGVAPLIARPSTASGAQHIPRAHPLRRGAAEPQPRGFIAVWLWIADEGGPGLIFDAPDQGWFWVHARGP